MSSDLAISEPPETSSTSGSRNGKFVGVQRPWLNLYGNRIRPVCPFSSAIPFSDPALIHSCLPDELLFEIFTRMTPYSLGRAACVCRKWRYTIRNPILWRSACLKAWQVHGAVENYRMVQSMYEGSWKKMWLSRPRIRTDGIYVSRNSYVRAGIAEWKVTNPVHLVLYYRYIRFLANGKFLYKNSSQKVKDVVKCLTFRSPKVDRVFKGDYVLIRNQIEAALLYPGMRPTLLRLRLRLRGTTTGANNRLDPMAFITTGVNATEVHNINASIPGIIQTWQDDDETHNPDVPAISHSRGLAPFVFVPFEEVETSDLNLNVDMMDYYVPG